MADVSDRFNFYDIYGYFLPGVTLGLLLVFPFWCYGHLPAAGLGFGSALASTVVAYIAGHLLQTIAVSAIPSAIKGRQPSDIMLDDKDATFTLVVKTQVRAEILNLFAIDVGDETNRLANRRDAFFLCRDALVASKQVSYVEQFEGMYTLMRGLSVALLLGAGYLAGWAWIFSGSHVSVATERTALLVGIALALASAVVGRATTNTALQQAAAKCVLAGLMLVLAAAGYFLGEGLQMTPQQTAGIAIACALTVLLYIRCHGAYAFFAREYAKTVWRAFLALRRVSAPNAPPRQSVNL